MRCASGVPGSGVRDRFGSDVDELGPAANRALLPVTVREKPAPAASGAAPFNACAPVHPASPCNHQQSRSNPLRRFGLASAHSTTSLETHVSSADRHGNSHVHASETFLRQPIPHPMASDSDCVRTARVIPGTGKFVSLVWKTDPVNGPGTCVPEHLEGRIPNLSPVDGL